MSNSVLCARQLGHEYTGHGRRLAVFDRVDLDVQSHQIVAVRGASGSGKTTLLLACGAMQRPTSGTVQVDRQNPFKLSPQSRTRFRAKRIGYVFQSLELVPYLNVLDNVRMAHGVTKETATFWLERLGLEKHLAHKPEALSHGQRQRSALARGIAHRPALVIADEPTGNLDPENSNLVFRTLREFADGGGAVLVATHEPVIEEYADLILDLKDGSLQQRDA